MMTRKVLHTLLILILMLPLQAKEGMWIPLLLDKYTIEDMQDKGFRLTAKDIYNINESSLKDAIVIFGGGCTGEVISDQGLLLTNHHCGYSYIQSHSTIKHDYLTDGFWAESPGLELPNKGLSVTFLERMKNVTVEVLNGVGEDMTESAREQKIRDNIYDITSELMDDGRYKAEVKSFYYGNEYYMFIYEVYRDVRLVGTPPGSIGNFGRDYDNWMWPRHTGDFSLFRIYADENNQPAGYHPDNIPYSPEKHLQISLSGVDEGDFTMVMGYPGSTNHYYLSDAVKMLAETAYPNLIKLREARLSIMNKYMMEDEEVRIQYAAKYKRVSNSWKKWQGIIFGLEQVNAVEKKKLREQTFLEWVEDDEQRKELYGEVLPQLQLLYKELSEYILVYEYANEAVLASEIFSLMVDLNGLLNGSANLEEDLQTEMRDEFLEKGKSFFKDYHQPIDVEIMAKTFDIFHQDIHPRFHPEVYDRILKRFDDDYQRYVERLFQKSILNEYDEIEELLNDYPEKRAGIRSKIYDDPLYKAFNSFLKVYSEEVYSRYTFLNDEIQQLYRKYVRGLHEMNTKKHYPDANFTMRLTYGQVKGYKPKDAVRYNYYTTLSGAVEKYQKDIPDYTLPPRLLEIFEQKDYGEYAAEDGTMRLCFIATNHTSGGNSGSPVLNADGHLVGLNFDRNWEGTMSDFMYDPEICRNISVDIRYVLFIIDKFAEAGYLVEEMDLVR